jgi:hypothetical protein
MNIMCPKVQVGKNLHNYCSNAKCKNFLHIFTWQFFQWCVAVFIWNSLMYTFLSFNSWHSKWTLHVSKFEWVTTHTFFIQMQNAKASYTSTCDFFLQWCPTILVWSSLMHTFSNYNYVLYLKIDMFFNYDTIFINVK